MPCPFCNTNDCTQTALFAADRAARIANLQASIVALGNPGKAERERQNASEFLRNLGVSFVEADIVSVPKEEEPPDVLFHPARFEIKEIYDKGRCRSDEYTQLLRDAEAATQCAELRPTTPYSPIDTTAAEVLALAIAKGLKCSRKYNERRGPELVPSLDLLLYHNLVDVIGMHDDTFPSVAALAQQGWRSVSVLFGHRAIVFCAAPDAPPWLRAAAGKVTHRPQRLSSRYDDRPDHVGRVEMRHSWFDGGPLDEISRDLTKLVQRAVTILEGITAFFCRGGS